MRYFELGLFLMVFPSDEFFDANRESWDNAVKNSANAQISNIKAQKKTQYDEYQAYLEYLRQLELARQRALEAAKALKNGVSKFANGVSSFLDKLFHPYCTCPYSGSAADFRRLEQNLPPLGCTCGKPKKPIYQPTLIYHGEIDYTGDLEYADKSKSDLKDMSWISWVDFTNSEKILIGNWKELAKTLSRDNFFDYKLETVVLDMIDHFLDGSGTSYSNSELTKAVAAHDSTQRFMKDFTEQFENAMKQYNGDYSQFANSDTFRKDFLAPNKVYVTSYFYEGSDVFSGLSMIIHSWTGVDVTLTSFKKNGTSYSGSFEFTFYDNFGLDDDDLGFPYGPLAGFRSWYILQHYDAYDGKYKPFKTIVSVNYDFYGSLK